MQGLGITIDKVELNRDLNVATVFWQSDADFEKAHNAIETVRPHIKRLFAKKTSHLKYSPDLRFIKKETYDHLHKADNFDLQVTEMQLNLQESEKTATKVMDTLYYLRTPLSVEEKQELKEQGFIKIVEPKTMIESLRATVEEVNYKNLTRAMEPSLRVSDEVLIRTNFLPEEEVSEAEEPINPTREEYDEDCDEDLEDQIPSKGKRKGKKKNLNL